MILGQGDRLLENHVITKTWVAEQMQKKFGVLPKVTEVHALGETVIGYMSAILRISLEWPESDQKTLPKSLIAKMPSTAQAEEAWKACGHIVEKVPDEDPIHKMMHETEIKVYSLFEKTNAKVTFPSLYGCFHYDTGHPILLIEDVRDSYTVDIIQGFTEKQVFAILDEIIALQKWSETNEWRQSFMASEQDLYAAQQFSSTFPTMLEKMKKNHPTSAQQLDILSRNFFEGPCFLKEYIMKYENASTSVFCHGDLWSPQILWRDDKIEGIVDWALCRSGNRMNDLLRILSCCCTVETRRNLTPRLLQYYAEKMNVTLEEAQNYYNDDLPYTCAMTMFSVSMWSHSAVLKKGTDEDEFRINEAYHRLEALIEDTAQVHGWK